MILNQYIQNLIRTKADNHLTISSQFETLAQDIFRKTGYTLSVNTLKRLFGKLPDVSTSQTTLNIIAEYLDFASWDKLSAISENRNSRLQTSDHTVYPKKLDTGTEIEVSYEPARRLLLQVSADKRCLVISSAGGNICKGDVLDIAEITVGYSLLASDVERDGKNMGRYVGGIEGGVKTVKMIS